MSEPKDGADSRDQRRAARGNWWVLTGFCVAAIGILGAGISYAVDGRWGRAGIDLVILVGLLAGSFVSWRGRRSS